MLIKLKVRHDCSRVREPADFVRWVEHTRLDAGLSEHRLEHLAQLNGSVTNLRKRGGCTLYTALRIISALGYQIKIEKRSD